MNIFIITSAIKTPFGVFSEQERIDQTLATIHSVRDRIEAKIYLLDGSSEVPDESTLAMLGEHADEVRVFSNSGIFPEIHKVKSQDIVKNACELMMMGSFLAGTIETSSKAERIFKISGRYILNQDFDAEEHYKHEDKIVVGKERFSQFPDAITGGINKQYMSRLISFSGSKAEFMRDTYASMVTSFFDRINNGGYIDVEHLLWQFLHEEHAHELPFIGVEGKLAPNGVNIKD